MELQKHGKIILARGRGIARMLDVCYKRGLSNDNSVLVVRNPGDLNSSWVVYDK